MRKYSIDTSVRVRLPHEPGCLAALCAAIAETGALVGDISITALGEHDTVRDVIVETKDEDHTARMLAAVRALPMAEVLGVLDEVFEHHRGGKIQTASRVKVESLTDLRYIYTPGVARVCKAIARDPALAWNLTGIGSSVGIFTNGTRVLSLGNIGPIASMPVMEGKAVLYAKFAGLSATPILIDSLDAGEFVETVMRLSRTFGGIHLEDIRIPECFAIEKELKARLKKPVMHDDQHGTATVALAAVLNACALTGVDPRTSKVGQIGLGAAGSAIARLALAYGVREVLVTDVSKEAVSALEAEGARGVDLTTLMRESHIVIATTGRPGLIAKELVQKGQVIFALSNPDGEIAPEVALAAGAAFAGDGRSVNNALAYPGIFKGALEARSRAITPEMLIAAASTIAAHAQPGEIVPSPLDLRVHEAVRAAVADKAREQGLAGTAEL